MAGASRVKSAYIHFWTKMAELMPDIKDGAKINIQYLPEVVLGRIADFLAPEDRGTWSS